MESTQLIPSNRLTPSSANLDSSLSMDEDPSDFCCPITRDIMEDPVIAPDGYTYDRNAITHYLENNIGKSPITRQLMKVDQLIPNRALKNLILEWRNKTGLFKQSNLTPVVSNMVTVNPLDINLDDKVELFAVLNIQEIKNHYEVMESLAQTIDVDFSSVYSGSIVEQSMVGLVGIYADQSDAYYRREPETTDTYFKLKFNSMIEQQKFVVLYNQKFPGFIKSVGVYQVNQLTKMVVDTKKLYENVAHSLANFHKNSHEELMRNLSTKLNVDISEVYNGTVVEQSLVGKAGITTSQQGAYFRRTEQYATNFHLKFASNDEYHKFINYYNREYPKLILKIGEYKPDRLTEIELSTSMLNVIADTLQIPLANNSTSDSCVIA